MKKLIIKSKKHFEEEKEAVYIEGLCNGAAVSVGLFGTAATIVGFSGLITNLIDRKGHEKISNKVNAEVAAIYQAANNK